MLYTYCAEGTQVQRHFSLPTHGINDWHEQLKFHAVIPLHMNINFLKISIVFQALKTFFGVGRTKKICNHDHVLQKFAVSWV